MPLNSKSKATSTQIKKEALEQQTKIDDLLAKFVSDSEIQGKDLLDEDGEDSKCSFWFYCRCEGDERNEAAPCRQYNAETWSWRPLTLASWHSELAEPDKEFQKSVRCERCGTQFDGLTCFVVNKEVHIHTYLQNGRSFITVMTDTPTGWVAPTHDSLKKCADEKMWAVVSEALKDNKATFASIDVTQEQFALFCTLFVAETRRWLDGLLLSVLVARGDFDINCHPMTIPFGKDGGRLKSQIQGMYRKVSIEQTLAIGSCPKEAQIGYNRAFMMCSGISPERFPKKFPKVSIRENFQIFGNFPPRYLPNRPKAVFRENFSRILSS